MFQLSRFQEAIREENLDGWLFVNFKHRDALTDGLLDLDPELVSTRRWFYLVPASGDPDKIVNTLENTVLDALPGGKITYYERKDLEKALSAHSGRRFAVLSDRYLQVLSTIDAASVDLLISCGIQTASAAPLMQRVRGTLDRAGIESHENAVTALLSIVKRAWAFTETAFKAGNPLYERQIQDFMLSCLSEACLITDHPPIVASGPNSANPHYSIARGGANGISLASGRRIHADEILQFDIWAKKPNGIYGDISWLGFTGSTIPERAHNRFSTLCKARDRVKPLLEAAFSAGKSLTGADVDGEVRSFLLGQFPETALRHRTGHGIDTECHGSGVNLDSVEFPDMRKILEGSCFSVEPGIYFQNEGYRTEIDMYIQDGMPVVSGKELQLQLMKFQDNT